MHLSLVLYSIVIVTLCESVKDKEYQLDDDCTLTYKCSGTLNSICKWDNLHSTSKCICKENYIKINQTHCGLILNENSNDEKCSKCTKANDKTHVCIDFNNDLKTDECICLTCNQQQSNKPPTSETNEDATDFDMTSKKQNNADNNNDFKIGMRLIKIINENKKQIVSDGQSLQAGDEVYIDINPLKDSSTPIKMQIVNCSLNALTSAHDIVNEKYDLIQNGCTLNDKRNINLKFQYNTNIKHLLSNKFRIIRLYTTVLQSFNCLVKYCPSSRPQASCDIDVSSSNDNCNNDSNGMKTMKKDGSERAYYRNLSMRLYVKNDDNDEEKDGNRIEKTLLIKNNMDDKQNRNRIKTDDGISTSGGSDAFKIIIITVVLLVGSFLISFTSIYIYRWCNNIERNNKKAKHDSTTISSSSSSSVTSSSSSTYKNNSVENYGQNNNNATTSHHNINGKYNFTHPNHNHDQFELSSVHPGRFQSKYTNGSKW